MPLYEYRCLKCEHVMEVLQKLNDPPLRRCKVCSGKVEKLISRTSLINRLAAMKRSPAGCLCSNANASRRTGGVRLASLLLVSSPGLRFTGDRTALGRSLTQVRQELASLPLSISRLRRLWASNFR